MAAGGMKKRHLLLTGTAGVDIDKWSEVRSLWTSTPERRSAGAQGRAVRMVLMALAKALGVCPRYLGLPIYREAGRPSPREER